jgi:hypothetical protein
MDPRFVLGAFPSAEHRYERFPMAGDAEVIYSTDITAPDRVAGQRLPFPSGLKPGNLTSKGSTTWGNLK